MRHGHQVQKDSDVGEQRHAWPRRPSATNWSLLDLLQSWIYALGRPTGPDRTPVVEVQEEGAGKRSIGFSGKHQSSETDGDESLTTRQPAPQHGNLQHGNLQQSQQELWEKIAQSSTAWKGLVAHGNHLGISHSEAFDAEDPSVDGYHVVCALCVGLNEVRDEPNGEQDPAMAQERLKRHFEQLINTGNQLDQGLHQLKACLDDSSSPYNHQHPTHPSAVPQNDSRPSTPLTLPVRSFSPDISPSTSPPADMLRLPSPPSSPPLPAESPLMPMAYALLASRPEDSQEPTIDQLYETLQMESLLKEERNTRALDYNDSLAERELLHDQDRALDMSDEEFERIHEERAAEYTKVLADLRVRAEALEEASRQEQDEADLALALDAIRDTEKDPNTGPGYFDEKHAVNIEDLLDISLDLLPDDVEVVHITADRVNNRTPPPASTEATNLLTHAWMRGVEAEYSPPNVSTPTSFSEGPRVAFDDTDHWSAEHEQRTLLQPPMLRSPFD